jgi:hypothetical protein
MLHSGVGFWLFANIRLGWKGLPGINALAYYENLLLMAVKTCITMAPDVPKVSCIKNAYN